MSKHENRSGFGPDATSRDAESVPGASHYNTVLSLDNTAKMFGVSRFLLRYYEWRGLIARRHRIGRVRAYSWANCERLAFITKCRQAGLSLRDVSMILGAAEDDTDLEVCKLGQERSMVLIDRLEHRRKVIEEALAELSHIYALLSTRILNHDAAAKHDR